MKKRGKERKGSEGWRNGRKEAEREGRWDEKKIEDRGGGSKGVGRQKRTTTATRQSS